MKRIFLIGYMGAGKTTLGKDLATLMGLSFIDLDYYIEERYCRTVSRIFAEKGEDGFRDVEKRMLHEVAMFEDVLISTGGGTPCFFDNMAFMNEAGTTVYLKVSVKELTARLEISRTTRPVLKNRSGDELMAFVAESLEKREPFYMQALVVFDAEVMQTKEDVRKLSQALMEIIG